MFLIYTAILIKFYKRKKNYENLREESLKDFYPKVNPIGFSASAFYIIPIRFELPLSNISPSVSLKAFSGIPGSDKNRKERTEAPKRVRTISTISRGFSFHVSYIKSSNYILFILLSFCIFHTPLFIFQAAELGRFGTNSI